MQAKLRWRRPMVEFGLTDRCAPNSRLIMLLHLRLHHGGHSMDSAIHPSIVFAWGSWYKQSLCAMRDLPWHLDPTKFICNQTYILLLFHPFIRLCTGEECPAMFRHLIEGYGCNRHPFPVHVLSCNSMQRWGRDRRNNCANKWWLYHLCILLFFSSHLSILLWVSLIQKIFVEMLRYPIVVWFVGWIS
jgi:hypothetical protein